MSATTLAAVGPPQISTLAWVAVVALLAKVAHWLYRTHKMFKQMPPGPRGVPLLGNILQFDFSSPMWIRLTEWAEEFGPIYSVNVAGQPLIVINSIGVAADLLDRRSHLYNDRPRMVMSSDLISRNMLMPFMPAGSLWQKFRRVSQEGLNPRTVHTFRTVQEQEAVMMLSQFLRDPGCYEANTKRSAASSIISTLYGWAPLQDLSHPVIQEVYKAVDAVLEQCLPGASLIDIVPALLHVPSVLSPWKQKGQRWHKWITSVFETLLDTANGPDAHYDTTFTSKLQDHDKVAQFSHTEVGWLAGSLFLAGTETTASTIAVFLLAMLVHPEAMRRGQAEIDRVVGRSRMPTFSDRENLPYITAMVSEVLRWRAPAPVGAPKRVTQDDWYNGYLIPKGATIIANIWAMNRDPEIYPDYDTFRPERFLTEDGQFKPPQADTHGQGHVSYGFGRRICVGMHMANQKLFIDIASILWAFNVENPSNEPPSTECIDSGAAARPKPFKCTLIPRSPEVVSIIEAVSAADNK